MKKIKELYTNIKERLIALFGKTIFHDVLSLALSAMGLLILLTLVLIIAFRVKATSYLVPLVYNSTFGVTALGSWFKIYFYPLTYASFLILNFLVAWAYFEKERLISYLMLFVSLLTGILLVFIEYNLTSLIKG